MVLWALKNTLGGEIFVPKIPSYKLIDVAKAICNDAEIKITGIRPGEKMHEELITVTDGINTIDLGEYYVITPSLNEYIKKCQGKSIPFKRLDQNFSYKSNTNENFLNKEEISNLIKNYLHE